MADQGDQLRMKVAPDESPAAIGFKAAATGTGKRSLNTLAVSVGGGIKIVTRTAVLVAGTTAVIALVRVAIWAGNRLVSRKRE